MKKAGLVILIILTVLSTFACNGKEPGAGKVYKLVEKDFGTYELPPGWKGLEEDSTETKTYYVTDEYAYEAESSNIIVEYGENDYRAAEYHQFMDAIAGQLAEQISWLEEATGDKYVLTASEGFGSEKGNRVLVFEVDGPQKTVQYYICGSNEYVLVQSTKYNNESGETVEEAALEIVQSFEWNDSQ